MSRRTVSLFAIFGVLAIGALLFAMAYTGWFGPRLQSYILSLRRCAYLSETQCARTEKCQATYEPSTDSAKKPEFRECRTLDVPTVMTEENLCGKTGGRWERQKFGLYCNCAPAGKRWTVDKGCQ
ncbi:MAG: hypothetical protein PHI63_06385 [Patescibacteria group bacterium]|nr:hypothetical protein [Patescibacteria group bacterium]